MINSILRSKFVLLFFLLIILSGCSKGYVRQTGKVTFADNGAPVPRGSIALTQGNFMARSVIRPDGTFNLESFGRGDGLPPGEYKVTFFNLDEQIGSGEYARTRPIVHAKYGDPETTDIVVLVDGKTPLEIVVDRPE